MPLIFFFNDTATTEIYTLSLHDALPICRLLQPHQSDALGLGGALLIPRWDYGTTVLFTVLFQILVFWRRDERLGRIFCPNWIVPPLGWRVS